MIRRRCVTIVVLVAAVLGLGTVVDVRAVAGTHGAVNARTTSGGTWGTAEEVPGLASLNTGRSAELTALSCASTGNCGAGGFYTDSSGHVQAFVVSQADGVWGAAQPVAGVAALNTGARAVVAPMSCASPGNCDAAGWYTDSTGNQQAFLVSETSGTWGAATPVPGLAALNTGTATLGGLSCSSAGNCTAGGLYTEGPRQLQAFVVSEVKGTWGKAIEVPGSAALNQGGQAEITSVSCSSAGNCTVGGYYTNSSGYEQPFVVSQTAGKWGTAANLPPTATLDGNTAAITSVSCRSAGNCSAGGFETNLEQAFVVREVQGRWLTPQTVWGLHQIGFAAINSVSCGSPGNCAAGGTYEAQADSWGAFLINEVNGVWGGAEPVPGVVPNQGGSAGTESVSCASAGNCSAAGSYRDASGAGQAFVVDETNGTWGTAQEVPGTAALNTGRQAGTSWVSCTSPCDCSAGGDYESSSRSGEAFVVSKTMGLSNRIQTDLPPDQAPAHAADRAATQVVLPSRLVRRSFLLAASR